MMTTMSEVIDNLKKEGYTVDFNLKESCLECHGNYLQIFPDEFVIDNIIVSKAFQTLVMKQ